MKITSSAVSPSTVTATVDDFEEKVLAASHDRLVVVDFWAEWCGPCKALAPILDDVAQSRADSVKVVKVDVDHEQRLAFDHGVRALPTLMFFRDGKRVHQLVGLQSADAIRRAIDEVNAD